MYRATPSERCSRNAVDDGRLWCSTARRNRPIAGASSACACVASSCSDSGVAFGGRPYNENSSVFQVITPVTTFSSKPPMRPSRWACCSSTASFAASSWMRRISSTLPAKRVTLTSVSTVSGTWSTRVVTAMLSARNGSPVA